MHCLGNLSTATEARSASLMPGPQPPAVGYHVALAELRPSLLRHGIDWRHMEVDIWAECEDTLFGFNLSRYKEDAPSGNYFWTSLPGAILYTWQWVQCPYVMGGKPPGMDIWKVDTRGLPLYVDPEYSSDDEKHGVERSFYTLAPVEPARLQLIATVTRCRRRPVSKVERKLGVGSIQRVQWHVPVNRRA